MKRTLHFSSVTSRAEQKFDPTNAQDIRKFHGDTSRLVDSSKLNYDLRQSYEYLKKHSGCATNFDLNRSERLAVVASAWSVEGAPTLLALALLLLGLG